MILYILTLTMNNMVFIQSPRQICPSSLAISHMIGFLHSSLSWSHWHFLFIPCFGGRRVRRYRIVLSIFHATYSTLRFHFPNTIFISLSFTLYSTYIIVPFFCLLLIFKKFFYQTNKLKVLCFCYNDHI